MRRLYSAYLMLAEKTRRLWTFDNGRLINRIQGKLNMPWIISIFATGYVSYYFHKDVKYVGRKISLLLQVKNRITA